jgi:hypothetical protein
MILLKKMPVVLTKDREWLATWFPDHARLLKPGLVITLPEDAILVEMEGESTL